MTHVKITNSKPNKMAKKQYTKAELEKAYRNQKRDKAARKVPSKNRQKKCESGVHEYKVYLHRDSQANFTLRYECRHCSALMVKDKEVQLSKEVKKLMNTG
jgi:NADH:ubiquinone oxidoreductase subunit D